MVLTKKQTFLKYKLQIYLKNESLKEKVEKKTKRSNNTYEKSMTPRLKKIDSLKKKIWKSYFDKFL